MNICEYLPPVCGLLHNGLSCYLSLYHRGDHEAPNPRRAVDSGVVVSRLRIAAVTTAVVRAA